MAASRSWDARSAFATVDDWNYGYVDRKNLGSFLRKHGYKATSRECIAIIRRMDLDADARLSMREFVDGLTPEEAFSKAQKRSASRTPLKPIVYNELTMFGSDQSVKQRKSKTPKKRPVSVKTRSSSHKKCIPVYGPKKKAKKVKRRKVDSKYRSAVI